VATAIVTRIDEPRIDLLFAIDTEARRQALSLEARHALPQQQSRPLLDLVSAPSGSAVERAPSTCFRTLQLRAYLWNKLTRFLEYPELELSSTCRRTQRVP
jgi:hypothetical protein